MTMSDADNDDYPTIPPLDSLIWLQGSAPPNVVETLSSAKDHDDTHINNNNNNNNNNKKFSLCLLIQPNCPGCHQNALPMLQTLYQEHQATKKNNNTATTNSSPLDQIHAMYIVSTAFEDFDYNTVESARLLLSDEQQLVGESRKALGPSAAPYYDKLVMPVAHDVVEATAQASPELQQLALSAMRAQAQAELQQQHPYLAAQQVQRMLEQINASFLPPKLAHYFWAVRARGTPTWVLHEASNNGDKGARVVAQWTGHFRSKQEAMTWIQQATAAASQT